MEQQSGQVRTRPIGEGGYGRLRHWSQRNRARRWELVRTRIDWSSVSRVLDLGGTPLIWARSGLTDLPLDITCVNILGEPREERHGSLTVRHVRGDATDLALTDGDYDLVFSNSVIEHVGGDDAIGRFARIARSGRQYYVQTPNRYFLLEPHFILPFHFLMPRLVKALIVMFWDRKPRRRSFAAAAERVDSVHLLSVPEMRELFPDGEMVLERKFGMVKSIMVFGGCSRDRSGVQTG